MTDKADFYLDITQDVCPMTFVRAKLMMERMTPGQVAEIRLKGNEPLTNVPRSLGELGHRVLSLTPEANEGPKGVHRLRVSKG